MWVRLIFGILYYRSRLSFNTISVMLQVARCSGLLNFDIVLDNLFLFTLHTFSFVVLFHYNGNIN